MTDRTKNPGTIEGHETPACPRWARSSGSLAPEWGMTNPSAVRILERGRTAYWDDATQSVVIRNPSAVDGGTVFKPEKGRAYFDKLK